MTEGRKVFDVDGTDLHYAIPDGRGVVVVGCMSWDWRGQPDLDQLDRIVANMTSTSRHDLGMLRVHKVDTGADEYGIVVAHGDVTQDQANGIWHAWWRSER